MQAEPPVVVKRWSKTEKRRIEVFMPKMIAEYNGGMGGVDLVDQMVGAYRIRIRKRK